MLIWMCALHCEAKPLIDFYRLKKSTRKGHYDLYHNKDIRCIVSGIGAMMMAAATEWAAGYGRQQDQPCWINLGIAGHRNMAIGSTVLASKISSNKGTVIYPPQAVMGHHFPLSAVTSVESEMPEYPDSAVCDMEAYAFMQTASRYSPLTNCHCIKVISDNSNSPAHRNKADISNLIAANIKPISHFACQAHQASEQHE